MVAEELVSVELLSGIASAEALTPAGTIVTVRPEVAAAWIADGLARAVNPVTPVVPEAAMRPRARARGPG